MPLKRRFWHEAPKESNNSGNVMTDVINRNNVKRDSGICDTAVRECFEHSLANVNKNVLQNVGNESNSNLLRVSAILHVHETSE